MLTRRDRPSPAVMGGGFAERRLGRLPRLEQLPSPAVIGIRPAGLLRLKPLQAATADVEAGWVLRHEPLVSALKHLLPGLEAVRGEPPHRIHLLRSPSSTKDDAGKASSAATSSG